MWLSGHFSCSSLETVFLTASAACSLAFLLFRHFLAKSIELGRLAKRCWALLKSFSGVCLKGRFPANAISLNWMQRDSAVLMWYDMQIKLSSPKLLAFLAVLPGAWQVGGHCQRFLFSFFHFFWCKQHVKLGCRASRRVGGGELDDIRSSGIVQAWPGFEGNRYQQTHLDVKVQLLLFFNCPHLVSVQDCLFCQQNQVGRGWILVSEIRAGSLNENMLHLFCGNLVP